MYFFCFRWGHSGYKKLYIDSSPSSSSTSRSPSPIQPKIQQPITVTRSESPSSFSSDTGSLSPPPGIRRDGKPGKRVEPPVPGLRPNTASSSSVHSLVTPKEFPPKSNPKLQVESQVTAVSRPSRPEKRTYGDRGSNRDSFSPSSYCSSCSFLSSRSRSGSFSSSFSSSTPSPTPPVRRKHLSSTSDPKYPTVANAPSPVEKKITKVTKNDKIIQSTTARISTTVKRTEETVRETKKLVKEKSTKKKQKKKLKVMAEKPLPPPPMPPSLPIIEQNPNQVSKKHKKKAQNSELPTPSSTKVKMKSVAPPILLPDAESLTSSDSDIEEVIVPKSTKTPLSERFGKLAQLSVERQRFGPGSNDRGMQLKIVRTVGNAEKEVYMEPEEPTRRSLSPQSFGRESLERRVAAYPGYRQGLPTDPRDYAAYASYIQRYRNEMSTEEYRQWQTWWLEYQDWLEEYKGAHSVYEREREREWRDYRRAWRSDLRVNIRHNKRSMF